MLGWYKVNLHCDRFFFGEMCSSNVRKQNLICGRGKEVPTYVVSKDARTS